MGKRSGCGNCRGGSRSGRGSATGPGGGRSRRLMATSAESTFIAAVAKAEAARQISKASAFTTWNYQTGSPLTTYVAALVTADNTFVTAVQAAANTAGG